MSGKRGRRAQYCVEDSCSWLLETEKHRHVTSGRLPCSSGQPKALFSWFVGVFWKQSFLGMYTVVVPMTFIACVLQSHQFRTRYDMMAWASPVILL